MTPNQRAFAKVVRTAEGTAGPDGYRTLFGGGLFESTADHPRQVVTRGKYSSTAAGAYQALERTWNDFIKEEGDHDFGPAAQDAFYLWCLKRRGAIQPLEDGDLDGVLERCSWEWASLPAPSTGTGRYGQPVISLAKARSLFQLAMTEETMPQVSGNWLQGRLTPEEYAAVVRWMKAEAQRLATDRLTSAIKGASRSWTVRLNAVAGALALAWPHVEPFVSRWLGGDAVAILVALYAAANVALRAKTDRPLAER